MKQVEIKKIEFKTYVELISMVGFVLGILMMPILLIKTLTTGILSSTILLEIGLIVITPLFYAIAFTLIAVITYLPFNILITYKKGMAILYESIDEEVV